MEFIEISLIIITVIFSVHSVYERGKLAGILQGREQILRENLRKAELQKVEFDTELETVMTKISNYI